MGTATWDNVPADRMTVSGSACPSRYDSPAGAGHGMPSDGGGFEALRQGLARVLGGAAILALVAGAAACNKSSSTGGGTTKKNCGFEIAYFR